MPAMMCNTRGEVSSIFAYPSKEHDSDGDDEHDAPPPPRAKEHDSDGDDEHVPPPPPPTAEVSRETRELKASRDRLYARSKKHLLCHYPVNASCEGCLSKSRNKSHYRGAFLKSTKDHANYITMDQLSVTDLHSSPGIGGFKPAIIFMRVDTGYWQFCPFKTLTVSCIELQFQNVLQGDKIRTRQGDDVWRQSRDATQNV